MSVVSLRPGRHEGAPGGRWRLVAGWAALSGLLHLLLIVALLAIATRPARLPPLALVPLDVGAPENRVTPYLVPAPAGRPELPQARRPATGLGARVLPEPETQTRAAVREQVRSLERTGRADTARVSVAAAPRRAGRRLLTPSYGDGRLWVPPIDILELGRPLPRARGAGEVGAEGPHTVAQLDSTVTARLRAFLDTMPPDSFAPGRVPNWTTEINGRTWGIDGKWIYLGGIKLPAALLALLPFPQGNVDQAQATAALMRMREDIMQAAQRAQTAEEFNKYVKELRQRKDREREEAKKRAPRDTVIP
jgi:hypothetical protein